MIGSLFALRSCVKKILFGKRDSAAGGPVAPRQCLYSTVCRPCSAGCGRALLVLLLATQSQTLDSHDSPTGTIILLVGAAVTQGAYRLMPHLTPARGLAGAAVMTMTLIGMLLGAVSSTEAVLAVFAAPVLRHQLLADRIAPTWATPTSRPDCWTGRLPVEAPPCPGWLHRCSRMW